MGARVFISFIASFIKLFFSKLPGGLEFSELSDAFAFFLFRRTRVLSSFLCNIFIGIFLFKALELPALEL